MPRIHQAGQRRDQSNDSGAVKCAVFDTRQNAGADFNYAEAAAQLAEAIAQLRLIQKLRGKN